MVKLGKHPIKNGGGWTSTAHICIYTRSIHGTGIFTHIYHKKSTIHVGKYISRMNPMGYPKLPQLKLFRRLSP